jgi:prepilin peptidase CpaA
VVYFQTAREIILLTLLVVAAYTDLASGKVCNWSTLPALFLGLLLAYVTGGVAEGTAPMGRGAANLVDSLLGVLLAGGLFGLYYLHGGGFGLGDVKLAAAVGALKGWYFALWAIVLTALVGGVMALGLLIWKGRLWRGIRDSLVAIVRPSKIKQATDSPAALTVPYAFAISVGTLIAWFRLALS